MPKNNNHSIFAEKNRDSNFELLRILSMLMIVTHHYCVNSGLTELINANLNNITFNIILIQFMSIGGKVGVSIFFLISGYFLINSSFRKERVVRLIFEILFYNIICYIFLRSIGYHIGIKESIKCFIPVIFDIPETFTGTYMLIYLLSPIINKCIKNISEIEYTYLIGILFFYFCIIGTFFVRDTWSYFGWGIYMYILGSFVRLNDYSIFRNKLLLFGIFISCTLSVFLYEIAIDFVGVKFEIRAWGYFVSNANKFPLFLMAISMFLFFKNMEIKKNKSINTVAASTFGVLLLHANSNTMRQWLWVDLFKNTTFFSSNFLWLHMILSVVSIYVACTVIDICRIKLIEKMLLYKSKKLFKSEGCL